jgi:phage gp45-like
MRDSLNRHDPRRSEQLIRNLVQRGVVTEVDASQKMQSLGITLKNGHKASKVEHWEQYGVTAHPQAGSEVLVVAANGDYDHLIVMNAANRSVRKKNLTAGEVAVHDDQGQEVVFKRGGIEIRSALGIKLVGPITIEGNITMTGNFNQTGVHVDSNGPHTA